MADSHLDTTVEYLRSSALSAVNPQPLSLTSMSTGDITDSEWSAALRVLRLAADADAPLPDRAELERLIQPIARAARRRRRATPPDAEEEERRREQSERDLAYAAEKDRELRRGTEMQRLHLGGEAGADGAG